MLQLIGLIIGGLLVYSFAQSYKLSVTRRSDVRTEIIKDLMKELNVDINDPDQVEKWVDLIARQSKK